MLRTGYDVVKVEVNEIEKECDMIFDMPSCGACRTCEIACSYHHTGAFKPSVSSLKILDKVRGSGYSVQISGENAENRIECDGCEGIEEPACLEVCKEKEKLKRIIHEFLERSKESSRDIE